MSVNIIMSTKVNNQKSSSTTCIESKNNNYSMISSIYHLQSFRHSQPSDLTRYRAIQLIVAKRPIINQRQPIRNNHVQSHCNEISCELIRDGPHRNYSPKQQNIATDQTANSKHRNQHILELSISKINTPSNSKPQTLKITRSPYNRVSAVNCPTSRDIVPVKLRELRIL